MRSEFPSGRWRQRWIDAHRQYGGHAGLHTLHVLYPRAVELYRVGASAAAAGSATAREYRLHSSAHGWRELAEQ